VTYQSLLFDRRRQLHRDVAHWYEQTYRVQTGELVLPLEPEIGQQFSIMPTTPPASTPLSPFYALLVYHWHQAEDEEQERYYANLVGQQAVAQFANAEAIGYLSRALALTPDSNLIERYNLLLARETVYDRLGEREKQNQDLIELAKLANQLKDFRRAATVALRQANYAEAIDNYSAALIAAQEAISQAKQIHHPVIESKGYIVWGKALLHQGNYQSSFDILEQALLLAQSSHHHHNQAESLQAIGDLYRLRGYYVKAEPCYQEALTICQSRGYQAIEAECLNKLGLIHYHLGHYEAALDCFEQAIPICYTIGNRRKELKPFHNIGLVYLKLGNYETARDYFEQAIEIGREIKDREVTANALSNLGLTYCRLGDYMPARSYLGQALGLLKEIGNQVGEANAMNKFGYVYYSMGDHRTTKRYCELALSIHQEVDNQEGMSYSLTYLGHALAGLGQPEAATDAYEQALCLRQEMKQPHLAVEILTGLADVALMQNKLDLTSSYVKELLAWFESGDKTRTDNLLWIYLKSYKILSAVSKSYPYAAERAQTILNSAYSMLQEQAAQLNQEKVRANFLDNVTIHGDLITAWKSREILSAEP
jgi:tetratricopeptide (TPR) repeat protein